MAAPLTTSLPVPSPSPQQHRLTLHGRELHFVAYEGTPANTRKGEAAIPAAWYLMSGGTRHRVMECSPGQSLEELDSALRKWAEAHAFGPAEERQVRAKPRRRTGDVSRDDWWSRR